MQNKRKVTPSFFKTKARSIVQKFALLALIWLLLIFVVSIFELVLNQFYHNLPVGFLKLLGWSLYLDILFWLSWILFVFIGFSCLSLISEKVAVIVFKTFIFFFFVIHLLLISYFNTALVMLGGDLFSYSSADVMQTVGASGGINLFSLAFFTAVLLIVLAILFAIPKRKSFNLFISLSVVALSFLIFIPGNSFSNNRINLGSDFADNLVTNKSHHFYRNSYAHFYPEALEIDIYADNYLYKFRNNNAFEYLEEKNFPFLRKETDSDVLTPFFEPLEKKPNIVIIIVEGLGRAFTNEGAYLGNFTPFLDSISGQSMYWKNFISQGGRTFAVLPSILGSLPFAENGFLEMGSKMPRQLSLINLLNFNGYQSSFYYGGNAGFDKMESYLKQNNISELNDIKSFPEGISKLPAVNGFTWGYGDRELFRHYLSSRPDDSLQKPQLSVLLTVAMHNPFLINEQEKYLKAFEERMTALEFDDGKKSDYRNYKNQYSSILYTDDALEEFFSEYKKREDYANTIFIITGDHRIPEIPLTSKIDRYHVPLMIFSPLLKRTAEIASISTHNDIAPSLLSFLKNNYRMNLPGQVSWQGHGLDTSRIFRNIHNFPLMQTKTDMVDFVEGLYHLSGNDLFRLNSKMEEEIITDNNKRDQLIQSYNLFKRKNSIIINGGKMIPDSLYTNYSQ